MQQTSKLPKNGEIEFFRLVFALSVVGVHRFNGGASVYRRKPVRTYIFFFKILFIQNAVAVQTIIPVYHLGFVRT